MSAARDVYLAELDEYAASLEADRAECPDGDTCRDHYVSVDPTVLRTLIRQVREPLASAPAYLGNPHDHPIWRELADEIARAMTEFGPMHSPHEGHSVIREELDVELWEHVCRDTGRSPEARHEALQVAAMAIRYILDLCEG